MGRRVTVRRGELVALAVYAAALAVALLAPTSGTQSEMASWVTDAGRALGLAPDTATQPRAEFLCNALILAPVSALGSIVWPRTTWRDWTAWTFVAALLVELVQGLLLDSRTASWVDVAANTLGGLLGAVVVAVAAAALSRRRRAAGTPPTPPAAPGPDRDPRS